MPIGRSRKLVERGLSSCRHKRFGGANWRAMAKSCDCGRSAVDDGRPWAAKGSAGEQARAMAMAMGS